MIQSAFEAVPIHLAHIYEEFTATSQKATEMKVSVLLVSLLVEEQ